MAKIDRTTIRKGMFLTGADYPAALPKAKPQPVRYGEKAPDLASIAKRIEEARKKLEALKR